MISFNKSYLDRMAVEKGFIRDNLEKVMRLAENEHEFIRLFHQRLYRPEVLFGKGDIACRISSHPMALWKCRHQSD